MVFLKSTILKVRTLPEKLFSFARLLFSHTLMIYHKFCPYGGEERIVIKNSPMLKPMHAPYELCKNIAKKMKMRNDV